MTRPLNVLTTGLVSLAFAIALIGMTQMAATSAKASAETYTAPVYGSAMLETNEDF